MDEYTREPCPFRIADDIGSAFSMGLIGGSIFHSIGAYRNAAKGQKLLNAMREVRVRSPLTGKKEDPYNSIISGAATGALLAVRSGPGVMLGSAALGGTILAMIEGVQVLMGKMLSQQYDMTQPQQVPLEDPKSLPSKPSSSPTSSSGNTVDVSFDTPAPITATPFGMGA
uniref:Uncharacterized protein n=1 Tax=Ditylenchus dipsaci TaxID=166011 RepID=A0A915EIW3_9BILA